MNATATTDSEATEAPERSEAELAAADSAYEQELVRLLFQLEYERERMETLDLARPAQVLEGVRRLAHELIEFADVQVLSVRLPGEEMSQAMTGVNDLFAAVERAGSEAAGAKKRSKDGRESFRHSMELLPDVVQSYLALFTGSFPSSRATRAWVEVAATFLVDLRQVALNMTKVSGE